MFNPKFSKYFSKTSVCSRLIIQPLNIFICTQEKFTFFLNETYTYLMREIPHPQNE